MTKQDGDRRKGDNDRQDSRIMIEERGNDESFVGQLPLNQQRRSTP